MANMNRNGYNRLLRRILLLNPWSSNCLHLCRRQYQSFCLFTRGLVQSEFLSKPRSCGDCPYQQLRQCSSSSSDFPAFAAEDRRKDPTPPGKIERNQQDVEKMIYKVLWKNPSLAELKRHGLDISVICRYTKHIEFYSRLVYDTDVKPVVEWLDEMGKTTEEINQIISRNPCLFRSSIEKIEENLELICRLTGYDREKVCSYLMFAEKMLPFPYSEPQAVHDYLTNKLGLSGEEIGQAFENCFKLFNFDIYILSKLRKKACQQLNLSEDQVKAMFLSAPGTFQREVNIDAMKMLLDHGIYSVEQFIEAPVHTCSPDRCIETLDHRIFLLKIYGKSKVVLGADDYISPRALADMNRRRFHDILGIDDQLEQKDKNRR